MGKTLVFTATYNEADNIEDLITQIKTNLPEADILICDDSSKDGTAARIKAMQKLLPNLKLIERPRKLGLGTAHKLAMKYALDHSYRLLITMDADFSHSPAVLREMEKAVLEDPKADFVIGSRYIEGGLCNYGFGRLTLSKVANFLTRLILGIRLRETTTSYRGFSRSLLQKLDIDKIKADGYSFFFESIYRIAKISDRLHEIPIQFEDRRYGTSKISKSEIIRGMLKLVQLGFGRFFTWVKGPNLALQNEQALDEMDCPNCQKPYHVELYPKRGSKDETNVYHCTSNFHSSHGRVVQCLCCSLVYTNPQPPPDQILKMYKDVEDGQYLENISSRIDTFSYNFEKVIEFLPKKGTLLDVGSYCGVFLTVAKEKGYEVSGVEPSKWASDYAKNAFGVSTFQGTVTDLPTDMAKFDIVTSWDVLEHFTDPLNELKCINTKLKPGGILAFSTLNFRNWFPTLMKEKWPWLMDMHLFYFDQEVIDDMLRKTGFQLLNVEKYCHIITLDYLLVKLKSLGIPGTQILRAFTPDFLLKRIRLPFKFGDIQLFVCKKI